MVDIYTGPRVKIEKTVFGLASPFIFQALVNLINEACKCYVPEITLDTAIDLCIPAHQKKTLLDIKKIAPDSVIPNQFYKLDLSGYKGYRLLIKTGHGSHIPVAPAAAGPACSCNIESYISLQEDMRAWISLSHRMSMGYWLLRYYNENNNKYNSRELRYLFHCLPALLSRALPIADEALQNAKLEIANARRQKADKIAKLSMFKAGYEQLHKLHKSLQTHNYRHAETVPLAHRAEIVNLNNSVAECLVLESNAPDKAPDLPMYLTMDENNFHPFFLDYTVDMVGLDPFLA